MTQALRIDPRDPLPIYAQLERAVRVSIATGALGPGDRLPTVRQLAVDLRINANTVARVYAELERAGVLVTRRGIGTSVAETHPRAAAHEDRERAAAQLVQRFLSEAATLGLSVEDLIERLRKSVPAASPRGRR